MVTYRFFRFLIIDPSQWLCFFLIAAAAATLHCTSDALTTVVHDSSSSSSTSRHAHRTSSIVTGANGFLGKAIVHELLLQQQHQQQDQHKSVKDRIVCLVRPSRVESEQAYWKKFSSTLLSDEDDDSNRVCLDVVVLPYDMLDGGVTLQRALDLANHDDDDDDDDGKHPCACCVVYHVASNFGPTENHQQTALDNVKGTEDLVRTVASHSLNNHNNKLVLTSSMAAVRATGQDPKNGKYYTTDDWNTLSELGGSWGSSYQWSKTHSEKRAWELANELGFQNNMVSICPSFVFGPPCDIDSTSSYSIQLVRQWIHGESQVQSRLFVDVRDAAAVHVAAGRLCCLVDAAAAANHGGKRYLCTTEARVSSQEIAAWLSEAVATTGKNNNNNKNNKKSILYDTQFVGGTIPIGEKEVDAAECLEKDLGVKLRSVKETISDMANILLLEQQKQQ